MPIQFIQGPGTLGFDPIAPLTFPGSGFVGNTQLPVPGGIVAPDWRELTRVAIDAAIARLQGANGDDPIAGGVMVPDPGTPGGPMQPSGGIFPTACGRGSFRNRTPWILGPNGFPTCPRGYHPLKDGQPYCVRNRRMNPLNPRALSRAGRRVGGFARAVKRARTLKKVCRSL